MYILPYYLRKVLSLKSKTPERDSNCDPHWSLVGAEVKVSVTETGNGKINRRGIPGSTSLGLGSDSFPGCCDGNYVVFRKMDASEDLNYAHAECTETRSIKERTLSSEHC